MSSLMRAIYPGKLARANFKEILGNLNWFLQIGPWHNFKTDFSQKLVVCLYYIIAFNFCNSKKITLLSSSSQN
jgi:hypothetical protein